MATGGSVPGRKGRNDVDSTETFDVVCSPCKLKNRTNEADKYCVDCQDYYCSKCVKVHKDVPAMLRHNIVNKTDFNLSGGGQSLPVVPTERCHLHKTKLVDMYCGKHDRVGCHACMSTEHSSCKVQYIPDNINQLHKRSEMKAVRQELTTTCDNFRHQLSAIEDTKKQLQTVETDTIGSTNEFKQSLLRKIEQLEQTAINDVKKWRTEVDTKLCNFENKLQQPLKQLEDRNDELEQQTSDAKQNNAQHFVQMKQTKDELSALPLSTDTQIDTIPGINFQPDDKLKKIMGDLGSLGTLQFSVPIYIPVSAHMPVVTESQSVYTRDTKSASAKGGRTLPVKQEKSSAAVTDTLQHSSRSLLKVNSSFSVDVKKKDDKKRIYILGSCIGPDGTILLADYYNNKLKRLVTSGSSLSLKDSIKLQDEPWSVCYISQQECAVSLQMTGIQFVSLGKTIKTSRDIKLNHLCRAIAYRDGELYVADTTTIYVYTTSGKPLRQLNSTDASGQSVFLDIHDMVISDSGDRLYVADDKKGLVAVDMQGRVLWEYAGPELKSAFGVCVDGRGNVFVSGFRSCNVLQVSESGVLVGEVVRKDFDCPSTVRYDRKHHRLITSWSVAGIVVYDFK